ncbi:MAG: nuclear transport factor 2 family protein [Actinomycetota bacterium]|nr:nuclear transport factor 2 family protein [Actinomycetota bacterium]
MTQANEEFMRETYDLFVKGGVGAIIDRFDDDIAWHIFGRQSPLARDWNGRIGVNEFFRDLVEMSEGTFRLEVQDVVAGDDRGVVFVHESARRNNDSYEMDTVHVCRIKNQKITEYWRYSPDIYRDDEFWS